MTIELTPQMEAIVTERLSSGRYSSPSAVIEEALHAMQSNGESFPYPTEQQRREKVRKIEELFAEIDAAGGLDFEIERDMRPAEERELW